MMNEKQFNKSQKECAEMLGMSLSEYQEYCKNLKLSNDTDDLLETQKSNTNEILDFLGIDKSALKTRKDY